MKWAKEGKQTTYTEWKRGTAFLCRKYFLLLRLYPWNKLIKVSHYTIKFKLKGLLGKSFSHFGGLSTYCQAALHNCSCQCQSHVYFYYNWDSLQTFVSSLHPSGCCRTTHLSRFSMCPSRGCCLLSWGNLAVSSTYLTSITAVKGLLISSQTHYI